MGVTMQLPEADRHTYTKGFLETQVAVLMGGRVAEEIFMKHMTSGASNDIERATDIAQHMVCEWGMSELGPLAYRKPGNAFEADRAHVVSEATAQRVDEEIRRVVMNAYDTRPRRHRQQPRGGSPAGRGAPASGVARGARDSRPARAGRRQAGLGAPHSFLTGGRCAISSGRAIIRAHGASRRASTDRAAAARAAAAVRPPGDRRRRPRARFGAAPDFLRPSLSVAGRRRRAT